MVENIKTVEEQVLSITEWMHQYARKNEVKGVVLGLSGGKDSTTVAMLSKMVFGNNVVAVLMPNGEQKDIQDSLDIAERLNLNYKIVNIQNSFDAIVSEISKDTSMFVTEKSKTNIAPRIRMTVLYGIAQSLGYQVIGTGNYSEAMVGWTTKFGDSACDFNPLGNLTKTEVVNLGLVLARTYGVDEKFIKKAPGDGLTGKTDEENLGFTYDELDAYLMYGTEGEHIDKIKQMIQASSHKRHFPESPLLNLPRFEIK